jgi:ketosteroid isomerase-like protein
VAERRDAVGLLRALHQAQGELYAGGDDGPVRALLTEDVVWHVPGRSAIAGTYEGVEAVLEYFRRRRELADRTLRLHPGDVLVGEGDHVAALTGGSAVIDGAERRWSTVGLYRMREGRIADCWLLPLDPETFDAIWAGPA